VVHSVLNGPHTNPNCEIEYKIRNINQHFIPLDYYHRYEREIPLDYYHRYEREIQPITDILTLHNAKLKLSGNEI